MRSRRRPSRARTGRLTAALLVVGASFAAPADAQNQTPTSSIDGITPHIDAVLYSPEVVRQIRAWGLTTADVQHDVDAMSLEQRARLAYLLTRRWDVPDTQSVAALQAQFLVMMSLMRESTLFASVITTRPSRLLR